MPGLSDTVAVTFDRFAIPHIAARSDADAFAALGYLHARERLWQMELFRRAAEGRLAEVLGPAAVSSDRFLRALDIPLAAERSLAILPAATQALLAAYVRGVNRWIAARPRPLPAEFQVLRFAPEPWTPRQSLEVARLMAWDLVNADFELDLARVAAKVGRERVRDLVPSYPAEGPVILPEGAGALGHAAGGPARAARAAAGGPRRRPAGAVRERRRRPPRRRAERAPRRPRRAGGPRAGARDPRRGGDVARVELLGDRAGEEQLRQARSSPTTRTSRCARPRCGTWRRSRARGSTSPARRSPDCRP